MFKVYLNGRLLAAIATGVVISSGVIVMGGNQSLTDLILTGGAPFKIEGVTFAATGFSTSRCTLWNGIVVLTIHGLSGEQMLEKVTIGGREIGFENTYVHAGETTTILLNFPWIQGYKYHVTLTSQNQARAEADSPPAPVLSPSNVTATSIMVRGPSMWLTLQNQGPCVAYLSKVIVTGPSSFNATRILDTPAPISPQHSSSLFLHIPSSTQANVTYNVALVIQERTLTYIVVAVPIATGGSGITKST